MLKKLSLIVVLVISFATYSQIPAYYNDVNLNLTGTALRDELATKVINTHTTTLSYGWPVIQQTDLDPDDVTNSTVLLLYGSNDSDGNTLTDRTRSVNSNGGNSGDWNREHTYPKSLGNPNLGTSGPGADVHHLRATDVALNSNRGSLRFATGSGVAGTSGSGWYPGDEWKGDVARMMMYMYIRYGTVCLPSNVAIGTTNAVDANMIDLLLDWNAADPVSQYEKNRNTILETEQGNRNPFIDNPGFATTIWGGAQAEELFSGSLADCSELFISEYIEGSGNNKFLEIYNPTSSAVDLSTYDIVMYQNGSATVSATLTLSGTLVSGDTFVIENSSEGLGYTADLSTSNTVMTFNGDDAIALRNSSTIVDVIGLVGTDPGTQWSGTTCTLGTEGAVLRRNFSVKSGDNDETDAFDPDTEWTCSTTDDTSDLGSYVNSCFSPEIDIQGNSVSIASGTTATSTTNNTDFGSIDTASGTVVKTFTILNTGVGTLTLSANPTITTGESSDFTVSVNPSLTVAGSGSTTFDVTFDPSLDGLRTTLVTVSSDDSDEGTYTFNISGTGTTGAPSSDCGSETFTNIGASSGSYATVNWTGDDSLSWSATDARTDQTLNGKAITVRNGQINIPLTSGGIGDFTITTKLVFSGSSGTFKLKENGVEVGSIPYSSTETTTTISGINISGNVTLTIDTNSSTSNRVIFDDISWTCYAGASAPEIDIQGNSVSIASGTTATSTTNNTDFGSIDTASGTVVKTFTILNTGAGALTLSGNPTITTGESSDFTVSVNPSLTVAGSGSTTFDVTFDPSLDGLRTTLVTVSSDDSDEGTYTFNISGTGTTGSPSSACGSETFTNSNANNSYASSSFTGDNSVVWTYVGGRDDEGYEITGKGLMLGGDTSYKVTSSTVGGGIGDFTMSLKKAFTGGGNRQVTLWINGILQGTSIAWDNTTTQTFSVTGINISGDIIIEIRNALSKQVILDDISWTCYAGASAPEIDIQGNSVSIASGTTATSTTNNTDFGSIDTASGTVVKTFTILNTGAGALTLSGNPTITTGESSDFTVSVNPSLTVAGSGSTTFDVTFDPSLDGLRTTLVTVSSDDSDEGTYTFNISGTGTMGGSLCGSELFISEYIEGSSQNKFLEIYNPTGASIDLSTYDIVTYVNGSASVSQTLALSGTIASLSTFVIENDMENLSVTADLSVTAGVMDFSGDDVVALRKSGTIIDVIGQIGVDPGTTWAGSCITQGNTLRRIASVGSGDTDGSNAFTTDTEWSCTTADDVSGLGSHTVSCVTGPEIDVQGNLNAILDGTTTTSSSNNTFFGSISVSSGTIVKTFTILNSGTSLLTLSGIPVISGTNSADFTLTTSPSLTLSASGSTTFDVTFDPSAEGTRNAVITILSDDVDEATYTFNISGIGTTGAIPCASGSGATIFQQDFEASPASPILTYTSAGTSVASGNGNTPSDPKYSGGSQGLQVSNTTGTVEFATFDSTSYSNLEFSVRLASFSGTSGNGAEATDYVKVFVSEDNGSSYSEELTVTGASANNARWSFTSGTGVATAVYDGDNITESYAPAGTGARTTDGYSTLSISSLPSSTLLKIKIELKNNNSDEFWVIDDAKVIGDSESIATWLSGSWTGTALANNVKTILETDYDMTTEPSFETCECEVKSGSTLTITADKYVKIENNLINNGNIIIEDSGSLIQVSNSSSVSGTGEYSVKRNTTSLISRNIFTYWSSPLASSTLADVAADADLYYAFDPAVQYWVWATSATAMTPGVGYIVEGPNAGYTYPGSYTAEFTGSQFNNGEISVTSSLGESVTAGADDNWNLVGNPYPSAIDASLFLSENLDLNGTIYFWTHNTDRSASSNFTQDDYVSWNGTGSIAGCSGCIAPTGNIAAGQAFFVQALAATSITFSNTIRVNQNNNNFYRSAPVEKDKIWLNLSSDISFNQILVGFIEGATDGVDRLYDGAKLDGGTNASFYTLIDEKPYSIQGKTLLKNQEVLPLGFKVNSAGDYTISIDHYEGNLEYSSVYVRDELLDIYHNLKISDYNFNMTETGTFDNRFKLIIYTNKENLNIDDLEYNSKLMVLNSPNNLVLRTLDNSVIREVVVYDLLGKEILVQENKSSEIELKSVLLKSNSLLIVKTLLDTGEVIINKIIKN
ncbi:choice-of-anchor D domain-containing protein [Polaribacter sp. Hel1_85]|uniref:choice-of-anchor D domain-containing protein n=1 Tax=Polaribacter sp. Hel1_85 TaxID=1250005 RepID=UPI00052BDC60|nr:choice-of-anchor D domain-containing protein [Polaribacter sp. Hel1_85]KGL58743.1 endonuclease I [Polaribacter sp. Hel1_85]